MSTWRCPYLNLAFEDYIFRKGSPHSTQLLFYSNCPSVIIGRNQNPWKEANLHLLAKNGVDLVRRRSGGGTVFHDDGNLNFCVFMPRERFQRDTYAQMVANALHTIGQNTARVNERHDLVINVDGQLRKVSGSAYKITRERAYHHGTLLCSSELTSVKKYLSSTVAANILAKGVESVRSEVANLHINPAQAIEAISHEFRLEHGDTESLEVRTGDLHELDRTIFKAANELKVSGFH